MMFVSAGQFWLRPQFVRVSDHSSRGKTLSHGYSTGPPTNSTVCTDTKPIMVHLQLSGVTELIDRKPMMLRGVKKKKSDLSPYCPSGLQSILYLQLPYPLEDFGSEGRYQLLIIIISTMR